MAASPGSAPTSSMPSRKRCNHNRPHAAPRRLIISVARLVVWRMTDDRSSKPAVGLFRPLRRARAQSCRRARRSCSTVALRRFRLDLSQPAPEPLTSLFAAHATSGLRSASAAANTCSGRPATIPDVGLIACEPFIDGVVKVIDGADGRRARKHPASCRRRARGAALAAASASIARAFVLFPDPWPKKRHIKRRLVNADLLGRACARHAPRRRIALATDICRLCPRRC